MAADLPHHRRTASLPFVLRQFPRIRSVSCRSAKPSAASSSTSTPPSPGARAAASTGGGTSSSPSSSSSAGILDRAIGLTYSDLTIGGGWIATIAGIVFLIPNLAVAVRRLHDTGRTGWWLLIGLVPVIGFFVLLYFFVLDSENDNQYGPYPKA